MYGVKDELQSVVLIGVAQQAEPYAFDMGNGFVPYRCDVVCLPAHNIAIAPLLHSLDLQHQGVPIEGEAGAGYRLGLGFDLPPLNEMTGLSAAICQRLQHLRKAVQAQRKVRITDQDWQSAG